MTTLYFSLSEYSTPDSVLSYVQSIMKYELWTWKTAICNLHSWEENSADEIFLFVIFCTFSFPFSIVYNLTNMKNKFQVPSPSQVHIGFSWLGHSLDFRLEILSRIWNLGLQLLSHVVKSSFSSSKFYRKNLKSSWVMSFSPFVINILPCQRCILFLGQSTTFYHIQYLIYNIYMYKNW